MTLEPSTSSPGLALPVVSHTLANGLTLLVLRREGAPVATFYTQFNIGSAYEHPGITGISHLLEHMLKKGTSTLGTRNWEAESAAFAPIDQAARALHDERRKGEAADPHHLKELEQAVRETEDRARTYIVAEAYDALLKRNGARGRNATTGTERTNFYVSLPAERAELWFALESARLKDLVFRDFYSERDVVMEERRRNYDTQPWGKVREAVLRTCFPHHAYGHLTIGTMEDLLLMDRNLVAAHFRRFYRARNCVAVVVGHVDPSHMIQLAERYFSDLPSGEAAQIPPLEEHPQLRERRAEVHFEAEPHMAITWGIPSAHHQDAPALAVLGALLTEGRTSRLYRRLVLGDRLATEVTCSLSPGELCRRLLWLNVLPRDPHSPEEVERVVAEEVERLQDEGISPHELQAGQNRREAHDVRRLQSHLGLAWQLGAAQGMWGDWRHPFVWSEQLRRVSAEDVRRVAQRYLVPTSRTVVILRRASSAPVGG